MEALAWEADELGELARLRVDTTVYGKTAIFKTAYWHTERCYLFLSRIPDTDFIEVEVRPKQKIGRDALVGLCREFCNKLIDQQVRQDVIAETRNVRDALIQKAFFEGRAHLNPDELGSDETHVPGSDHNHAEDPLKIGKITGG